MAADIRLPEAAGRLPYGPGIPSRSPFVFASLVGARLLGSAARRAARWRRALATVSRKSIFGCQAERVRLHELGEAIVSCARSMRAAARSVETVDRSGSVIPPPRSLRSGCGPPRPSVPSQRSFCSRSLASMSALIGDTRRKVGAIERWRRRDLLSGLEGRVCWPAPNGRPRCSTGTRHDDVVRVEVHDDGPGIREDHSPRVFTKFSRGGAKRVVS
jgi:hypothetical protein